jgi:CDP-diacylglycerol pyrophosphatase
MQNIRSISVQYASALANTVVHVRVRWAPLKQYLMDMDYECTRTEQFSNLFADGYLETGMDYLHAQTEQFRPTSVDDFDTEMDW